MSETLIANIIREVAEIERDPLPGQPDDEMRVTADELRAILETAWNTRTPDAEAERLRSLLHRWVHGMDLLTGSQVVALIEESEAALGEPPHA